MREQTDLIALLTNSIHCAISYADAFLESFSVRVYFFRARMND